MVKLNPLMTNLVLIDARSESKAISGKVKELVLKHLGAKPKDKSKGSEIKFVSEFQNKEKTVTATVEAIFNLHVSFNKDPVLWVATTLDGEKTAVEKYRPELTDTLVNLKKDLDGLVNQYKTAFDKKNQSSKKLPEALTDSEWKRVKNLTLTDTGLGKALREWEEARPKLDDEHNRSIKAFEFVEGKLVGVEKAIDYGLSAAKKGTHDDSIWALEGFFKLVDKARKELKEMKAEHLKWVDRWGRGREGDLKKMHLMDLQVRGYISTAVTDVLKQWKAAKENNNYAAKKEMLEAMEAAKKELERLRKEALKLFSEILSVYRDKNAPPPEDWNTQLKTLTSDMRKLVEKMTGNCDAFTLKLKETIGELEKIK